MAVEQMEQKILGQIQIWIQILGQYGMHNVFNASR